MKVMVQIMPNLKIDMSRFDELKAMSLEKLIEFRDWECQKHDRPSGLSDDMFNLWIGRKTGDWLKKDESNRTPISEVEKKYIAYLEAVNKPSKDLPF